jgi:hypothetical protein
MRGMVVPSADKKAADRLDGLQAARRERANDSNQIPAWKYAGVGKEIAAHDFCKWLVCQFFYFFNAT